MLELRKQTVVHRNGTISTPDRETPRVSSTAEPDDDASNQEISDKPVVEPTSAHAPETLRFAGTVFNLAEQQDRGVITFVSDDKAAKNAVAPLESMGLAGKWQQAGTVKIRIQNSGPPGAAVSLCIQLPEGRTLADSATSLATWGIELAA